MAQSQEHLFTILPHKEISKWFTGGLAQDNAAPEMMPVAGFNPQSVIPQLINVVGDFEWTHTPRAGRNEVPYIRLSEQRVNFNSLVQNLRYLL